MKRFVYLVLVVLYASLLGAQVQCATGVCVTTWHNDNLRTGQNTNEQTLTEALVSNDFLRGSARLEPGAF